MLWGMGEILLFQSRMSESKGTSSRRSIQYNMSHSRPHVWVSEVTNRSEREAGDYWTFADYCRLRDKRIYG